MLINCVAYRDGRKVADVPTDRIQHWLGEPGCLVWVALRDASDDELARMQREFDLHALAIEDARHGHQRPKIEEYGDVLFIVMQVLEAEAPESPQPAQAAQKARARRAAPDPEPVPDDYNIGELAIFVGSNFVLSVRNRSKQDFLGVRTRCEREPQLLRNGAGYVSYALMDAVVDRYFPLLDGIETELDEIESHIFSRGNARSNIERLYALKHRTTTLRHAVAPLLEVAGKLHGGRVPPVCAGVQEYFRDVHDHLVRIAAAIDRIRDTIGTAIQVNLSMVTIEESEITKRLAAWAAIFAVSTALAGIWGMNFEHMPELKWTFGYPLALGVIAAAGGILYWRFRKAGWL